MGGEALGATCGVVRGGVRSGGGCEGGCCGGIVVEDMKLGFLGRLILYLNPVEGASLTDGR